MPIIWFAIDHSGDPIIQSDFVKMAIPLKHRLSSGFEHHREENWAIAGSNSIPLSGQASSKPVISTSSSLRKVDDLWIAGFGRLNDTAQNQFHKTIALGYQRYGERLNDFLHGELAWILYDPKERLVLAGNDFLSNIRLFFKNVGELLLIGSEARILAAHPLVNRRPNLQALAAVCFNYYPTNISYFEKIEPIPAGYTLICRNRTQRLQPGLGTSHWNLNPYCSLEEGVLELKKTLSQAVRDRLQHHKRAAVHLSGGLDCSSVAATLSQELSNRANLHGFSFDFPHLPSCQEWPMASALAKFLQIQAHPVPTDNFPYFQGLENRYKPLPDSPFFGWYLIDQEILLQISKLELPLLFTGHGGDCIFRLTNKFNQAVHDFWLNFPRNAKADYFNLYSVKLDSILKTLKHLLYPKFSNNLIQFWRKTKKQHKELPFYFQSHVYQNFGLEQYEPNPHFQAIPTQAHFSNKILFEHPNGIPNAIHYFQEISEPHGVDTFHPLWDERLFQFAFRASRRLLPENPRPKEWARLAMRGCMPEAQLNTTTKTLFTAYCQKGLMQNSSAIFQKIENMQLESAGIIKSKELKNQVHSFLKLKPENDPIPFLGILSAELWLQDF